MKHIIISDLHIGINDCMDIFRQNRQSFFDFLDDLIGTQEGIELIINGDSIDFLQLDTSLSAVEKIGKVIQKQHDLIEKFKKFLSKKNNRLVILPGNHDLELMCKDTRDLLMKAILDGKNSNGKFIILPETTTGYSYEINVHGRKILIEHGNQFDNWNRIDFDDAMKNIHQYSNKEKIRSYYPIGSLVVIDHINPLKKKYPFLDIMQTPDILTFYILAILEPKLLLKNTDFAEKCGFASWEAICSAYRQYIDNELYGNKESLDLPEIFQEYRTILEKNAKRLSKQEYESNYQEFYSYVHSDGSDLETEEDTGDYFTIPGVKQATMLLKAVLQWAKKKTLQAIRYPITTAAKEEFTYNLQKSSDFIYAQKIMETKDVDHVILGHTHKAGYARSDKGIYWNSGTWASLMKLPNPDDEKEMTMFLKGIKTNNPNIYKKYMLKQNTYIEIDDGSIALNLYSGSEYIYSSNL